VKSYSILAIAALTISACATPEPTIEGLWLGELEADAGTPVAIELSILGDEVIVNQGEVVLSDGALSIAYDEGAVFSGSFMGAKSSIRGFYIQPSNNIGGQQLAHSVDLSLQPDGKWRGAATPLARQISIFMDIVQEPNAAFTATLLNPERNITGPIRQYDLVPEAEEMTYSLQIPNNGRAFTLAKFDLEDGSMRMDFGPLEDFELSLLSDRDPRSVAFFDRKLEGDTLKPVAISDWPVGTPEEAGFSTSEISDLIRDLKGVSGQSERPQLVHSLLIARNGNLIVEEYFRGHDAQTPHDMRSAGKTFASVLVGALIQEGRPLSSDTPINKFISVPKEPKDAPVTVGHLLTHQGGFDCYDGDGSSSGNENTMWEQSETPNFWEFTAGLEFVAKPGSRYAYCSGGINLVGAALAGITGETVLSLLQTRLFQPLGFENAYWNVMPNGQAYLGGGAQLRTRDLLKIGQVYLDGGKWRGEQLIDAEWVKSSIAPKAEITPDTTGLDESSFSQFYFGGTDGYAWHLHPITLGSKTYESYEASGNGGQLVVVIPELDLVVGMTGGNYGQGYIWGKWRQEIIGNRIITALAAP